MGKKLQAVGDSIIVRNPAPIEAKTTTTASGLVLVQAAGVVEDKTYTAEVISVGEGAPHPRTGELMAPPVKVGDKIIVSTSSGVEIDKDYRMIRTDDIFAVVTE